MQEIQEDAPENKYVVTDRCSTYRMYLVIVASFSLDINRSFIFATNQVKCQFPDTVQYLYEDGEESSSFSKLLLQNHQLRNVCSCYVSAIMAHFFFLAAFFWLNTMCFNIWWTFRYVVIYFPSFRSFSKRQTCLRTWSGHALDKSTRLGAPGSVFTAR